MVPVGEARCAPGYPSPQPTPHPGRPTTSPGSPPAWGGATGAQAEPHTPGRWRGGGGAGGPRSYPPGEPCPLLARLASTSWQDVRTVREQFLTSGRTLALKGKEHRTLGAVVRAPLRDGVSTHLGGAGQGLCPRPPHLGSQPRESGPPGSGALIPP